MNWSLAVNNCGKAINVVILKCFATINQKIKVMGCFIFIDNSVF